MQDFGLKKCKKSTGMSALVRIRPHSSAFIRLGRCCGRTSSRLTVLRMGGYYSLFYGLSSGCGATIHYSAATILRLWRYYTVLRSWCSVIYYHFHSPAINYSIFFVSFGMNGNNLNNVRDEIILLWHFSSLTLKQK